MFMFNPEFDRPISSTRQSGHLLEMEQRMTEFIARTGDAPENAVGLIHQRRDEVRRERLRGYEGEKAT